jgi:MoxR-like ATPase
MGVMVSDRRWYGAMDIVRAEAWLSGRGAADPADLRALVPVLWSEPSQYPSVRKTVYSLVSPYDAQAEDLLDQAIEVHRAALAAPEEQQTSAGVEATKALKSLIRKIETAIQEAKTDGKSTQALEDALARVSAMNAEVLKVCLKVA